jgi:hypothetical protein
LGSFGRRLIDWVVLAFAAYAFAFVPLGKKTALQHLRAILATDAAQDAGGEIQQAGRKLVGELTNDERNHPRPVRGTPELPKLAPPDLLLSPSGEAVSASDEDPPDASL